MLSKMPRDPRPQSVLQRHLQTIFSHTTNNLDVCTSAVQVRSRKRCFSQLDRESGQGQDIDQFKGRLLGVEDGLIAAVLPMSQELSVPQVHLERDKEVDKFKGRLLGVEDGLIDAIVSGSCPIEPDRQQHVKSSTTFPRYPRAEAGVPEIQLLQPRKRPSNILASPAERGRNASAGSPFPHSHSGYSNTRCSNVDNEDAAQDSAFTNAVSSRCDNIPSDDSVCNGTYSNRTWSPIETQHATTKYSILPIPAAYDSSPSTCESDMPEVTDASIELDGIVVDSIMLERSDDDLLLLGTWDLSNWRTLGFTMSDLLLQGESCDGRC